MIYRDAEGEWGCPRLFVGGSICRKIGPRKHQRGRKFHHRMWLNYDGNDLLVQIDGFVKSIPILSISHKNNEIIDFTD